MDNIGSLNFIPNPTSWIACGFKFSDDYIFLLYPEPSPRKISIPTLSFHKAFFLAILSLRLSLRPSVGVSDLNVPLVQILGHQGLPRCPQSG